MAPCSHCAAQKIPVEIEGQRLHTFSDRWIPCTADDHQSPQLPAFVRFVLWIQLALPLHHLNHVFHLIRSRF